MIKLYFGTTMQGFALGVWSVAVALQSTALSIVAAAVFAIGCLLVCLGCGHFEGDLSSIEYENQMLKDKMRQIEEILEESTPIK